MVVEIVGVMFLNSLEFAAPCTTHVVDLSPSRLTTDRRECTHNPTSNDQGDGHHGLNVVEKRHEVDGFFTLIEEMLPDSSAVLVLLVRNMDRPH